MSIPTDPQVTVVKRQNLKTNFSRNTPAFCVYPDCERLRQPDEPPFKVCASCRSVQYCCREHQRAHWRDHKPFCQLKASEPEMSVHTRELEDFARLHYRSFGMGLAALLRHGEPVDWSKNVVIFELASTGSPDPAKRFKLVEAHVTEDESHANTPLEEKLAVYRRTTRASRTGVDLGAGYIDYAICFFVSERSIFYAAHSMYQNEYYPCARYDPWYILPMTWIGHGLVWSSANGVTWPGVMKKVGSKWVWKEQTKQDLQALGLRFVGSNIVV
ncbi:hypothetical protein BDP27DRAFT_1312927 [Rhodocollybia butyracea]|uniref:MYND-type domain-containing protein n=1 Tax=Rhodocollybia butyracea TaxID=206335 RepID=A0A9P5Q836_9AGAR|nr:hypothetical protein BDP27DRAFT_1312927 [Rhodocollybia butyracea]